jgi:hypothetical protein
MDITFKKYFNGLFKLSVGIHDEALGVMSDIPKIHVLVNKLYSPKYFQIFSEYLKNSEDYIHDYQFDVNLINPRLHMFVFRLPQEFELAYYCFLEGKYSIMYTKNQIDNLFKDSIEREILLKEISAQKRFKKTLSTTFNIPEHHLRNILGDREYELPLINKEEIFNYNGTDYFFNKDKFIC